MTRRQAGRLDRRRVGTALPVVIRAKRNHLAVEDFEKRIFQRLRTENTDLRRHLEIYEEHIRMLTIDNTTYRSQLERLAGVTELNTRRNP